ncbi:MAG TPA: DUF4147 domain-containing protein, partial [Thermoanaerobaculia bacterium]
MLRDDLLAIYRTALDECDPARLAHEALEEAAIEMRVDLVSIGKCAAPLFSGAAEALTLGRAFLGVPSGYALPVAARDFELAIGSHPDFTDESFAAGRRLLEFVRSAVHPVVFLISGGASASVEFPLEPWFAR